MDPVVNSEITNTSRGNQKPVMHVKMGYVGDYIAAKKMAQNFKKAFSDRFEIIFSLCDTEIKVDNILVLEIGKDTDFEKLIEAIDSYYQNLNNKEV